MSDAVRRIGLSLGTDLVWPRLYEALVEKLGLRIRHRGEVVRVEVSRREIRPFSLRASSPYDLVIDRLTHWFPHSREWIKKAILMDGLYVYNNPWSIQAMEKQTTYCALMALGFPVPDTWMIPAKEYTPDADGDLEPMLRRYARFFDLGEAGDALGYPLYMKPYDGGGWRGVTRIENEQALRAAYEQSGKSLMHLQAAIEPYDGFVRAIGVGPQVRLVPYDPGAPMHDRYSSGPGGLAEEDREALEDTLLTVNTLFGWDFNSCESLLSDGTWHPIDFANPCPDSRIFSLHYHLPWLIKAHVRWSVFCAVTRRKMRRTLDWEPFYQLVDEEDDFLRRRSRFGAVARARLDEARFQEFCDRHLADLDEVAADVLGGEWVREVLAEEVAAHFPAREVDEFTDLFWERFRLGVSE